jgi:hypothetical protein
MRHSFSAEFLKVRPPATNFGEAWEHLCLRLLHADTGDSSIMRLGPPDRGIDILRQSTGTAYQCKSTERGSLGTIGPKECVASLARAIEVKEKLAWKHYYIATNAPLSGDGLAKIIGFATSCGLAANCIMILSHEYWNDHCERHKGAVKDLFDFRASIREEEVIEAFRKARYYDSFIEEAKRHMKDAPLTLSVSNNRTTVELVLPFSGEMTIGELLHAVAGILGISLDWANFPDLGTSSGPSLSIMVDRKAQSFSMKLSELTAEQRAKLQLWIKLIWSDELDTDRSHYDGTKLYFSLSRMPSIEKKIGERPKSEADAASSH